MNNVLKTLIMLILFVVFLALVIVGQKNIGYQGLATQIVGLAGLLGLLYTYNRKYK